MADPPTLAQELLKRYEAGERDFNGADLRGANLGGACLEEASLEEADLEEANLGQANLEQANLEEANLWEANLEGARLREADLWGAYLRGARLEGAKLEQADLRGADLGGSDLTGANLRGADLRGANLWGADLKGANLEGAGLLAANLKEACLRGALLTGANLWGASLRDADLRDADLRDTNLRAAELWGADLMQANLEGANLGEANLRAANLRQANFLGTSLERTALVGVDLGAVADVESLQTVRHAGPSYIDTHTLRRAEGKIPPGFLKGCGLSDWEIEAARLYDPGLSPGQITEIQHKVFGRRADLVVQVSPLFISHSNVDSVLVDRVGTALDGRGIRYWRDTKDATAGPVDSVLGRILTLNPTVLLVLSEHSVNSPWIEREVDKAVELSRELGRDVLCPITLDDAWKKCGWSEELRAQIEKYVVLDFADEGAFDTQVAMLLESLQLCSRRKTPAGANE